MSAARTPDSEDTTEVADAARTSHATSAPSAKKDLPGPAELEEQAKRLVLPRFGYDEAWRLGSLLVELARARRAPVAIDIHQGAQQLFHCALPGSSADNDGWIARKRRVAERYGAASLLVGARFRAKGQTFEESSRLDPGQYAAHGGAVPVVVEGAGMVATATVSGLPQAEDHALVAQALELLRSEL
ncbi:heme-degrading domain-containing protein [Streptomyces sp. NBC_01497]|uniref:heme-degrading domain-containing protein n=1 Tax=Streptomyces sp. NBC_01497 TaxID=2903885 RepID=UPI002E353968|nr:heme-degrading domain-containing protein [Streptomyces sp. NBC_01497]